MMHDVNARRDPADPLSETPLLHALAAGFPMNKVVALLLKRGAKSNATGRNEAGVEASPLMFAALNLANLTLLLDAGAQVDWCRPSDGQTALHVAATMGRADCVRLLVERGGDVLACDSNGNTPLDCARQANNHPSVELLQELTDLKRKTTPTDSPTTTSS